jgi:4-amino-4-deoxy-L-arabinose transferase-like glycosyltransferase
MPRATQLAILLSILGIAARLIWIDQPFTDNWSWRQSDVAAIARNYFTGGFHLAHPQIDWAGNQPGYVGTEFPILPFIAALCYKFFGVHEWIGRAQAVILFAVSLPFFFLLVREVFGESAANWATFFYIFAPVNLFTGREFMPDTPSLSLGILGLYLFFRWIEGRSANLLLVGAGAISLSILIKAPSAIIGLPLACLAFQRFRAGAFRRIELWIFAAITLLPPAIWYAHARDIAAQFYPHHFFGAGGIRIMNASWYWKIARQVATSSLTPVLFALALGGAFVARSTTGLAEAERRRGEGLRGLTSTEANGSTWALFFYWWLAAMILFVIVVGYGNRHQWYQLPLVPIAAAFAGTACGFIDQRFSLRRAARFALSTLLAVSFGVFAIAYVWPLYHSRASTALRDLGLELKTATPPNALIVAADNGDPTAFYYAERKGWHFLERDGIFLGDPLDSPQAIADLEKLRHRGATYLALTWATRWWLDYYKEFGQYLHTHSTLMKEAPEFTIYRLDPLAE